MQTAVNDAGFEVDIIRRQAGAHDPHPLRMSDDENDLWADQGEKLSSGRDPLKAPKDRLQAQVVQEIWDGYLKHAEAASRP
ncbi:MAG: hypothetical protein ABW051_01125 [Burkholderiaceae bacterium]